MTTRRPEREAAARDDLGRAREPSAAGPRADLEAMRTAYLDLLKLCLVDLGGSSTMSVVPSDQGPVLQELKGDRRRLRVVGLDWPLQGVTMSGLNRLDDLQRCVSTVVSDGVEGDLIEAGVWRGGSSILMRATLDSLGADERTVWVADSFEGFPGEDRGSEEDLNAYLSDFDFLAVPEQEVRDNFARFGYDRGVRFVPGLFQDTMPGLSGGRWAIVRLDADSYDATRLALETLYPALSPGGYLIVDDYEVAGECRQAVDEYRDEHGIAEPIEPVDWTCVRWRRGATEPAEPPPSAGAPSDEQALERAIQPPMNLDVPTLRELVLTEELARVGAQLERLERELQTLSALRDGYERSLSWRLTRPLRAAGARLRGRLR